MLRIFDVDRAREFYLSEHDGDGCPGAVVFVRMTGLDEYHQEISAKGYRYLRPGIETMPWHARMMQVTDPFGNRLRFNEDMPGPRPR